MNYQNVLQNYVIFDVNSLSKVSTLTARLSDYKTKEIQLSDVH